MIVCIAHRCCLRPRAGARQACRWRACSWCALSEDLLWAARQALLSAAAPACWRGRSASTTLDCAACSSPPRKAPPCSSSSVPAASPNSPRRGSLRITPPHPEGPAATHPRVAPGSPPRCSCHSPCRPGQPAGFEGMSQGIPRIPAPAGDTPGDLYMVRRPHRAYTDIDRGFSVERAAANSGRRPGTAVASFINIQPEPIPCCGWRSCCRRCRCRSSPAACRAPHCWRSCRRGAGCWLPARQRARPASKGTTRRAPLALLPELRLQPRDPTREAGGPRRDRHLGRTLQPADQPVSAGRGAVGDLLLPAPVLAARHRSRPPCTKALPSSASRPSRAAPHTTGCALALHGRRSPLPVDTPHPPPTDAISPSALSNSPTPPPRQDWRTALDPLPLELPSDEDARDAATLELLAGLGLRTLGELRRLPPAGPRPPVQATRGAGTGARRTRRSAPLVRRPLRFHHGIAPPAPELHAEALLFAARRFFASLAAWLDARHAASTASCLLRPRLATAHRTRVRARPPEPRRGALSP